MTKPEIIEMVKGLKFDEATEKMCLTLIERAHEAGFIEGMARASQIHSLMYEKFVMPALTRT